MNSTIGVDLGGTKIKAGTRKNDNITDIQFALLRDKDSLESTLNQLKALIASLINPDVKGIGIGVPSVVDVEKGIVYDVVNIPSWKKVELKDILEEEFKLPVAVNNDANCFALGEHKFGKAKAFRNVIGITIGTGLGAGVIVNNELYNGSNCGAGEIGMLSYLDENYEHYCSSSFFDVIHQTNALETFKKAEAGDATALSVWSEFGGHIGNALKAVVYAFDPDAIVLGGSIAKAYAYFSQAMMDALQDFAYPQSIKKLKILKSENEDITLLGASGLVM